MRNRGFLLVLAFLWLVVGAAAFAQTPGVKLVSGGEFKDKDGAVHSWKINGAHTLFWDGEPYTPVGGVFYPKYVCLGQTDENWQADVQALELLKGKGITDLLLKSILPVTFTKPEAWQRLLDYLDSSGFAYGIDFSDGPVAPLNGFIVEPGRYRVSDITKDVTLSFDMPDVVSAIWVLCRVGDGSVVTSGGASVSEGKVTVRVKAQAGENCILLLYPAKEFSDGGSGSIADLWGGFDEFRDRLVKFTSAMKFGKGLRFFVDPLAGKMDFVGEHASIVPDSAEFRIEFEAYLAKKYLNIGSLNTAWALKSETLETFEQAARLIPLWRGAKGIPAILDRARGKRISVDAARSRIWDDLRDFRDSSAQTYLNSAADLLKRTAANVPVIYRASHYHRVFANAMSRGGFDGLGVEAYGRGQVLVTSSAGPAYSLAEESARSTWFVVTGTNDTPRRDKSAPAYPGRDVLIADLDSLAEIGAKGIFVLGLQVLPEETMKSYSLALVPEQLDWLKAFKDGFATAERADFAPKVIYYPVEPVTGAVIARLGPGVWWLPSLRTGSYVYLGDSIGAYTLAGQAGVCMWSRSGASTASFPISSEDKPAVSFPPEAQGVLSVQKGRAVLKLGESPMLVTGLDPLYLFPFEAAAAEIARLAPLVARAKSASVPSGPAQYALDGARQLLKTGATARAYDKARTYIQQLGADLGSYLWIEGEQTASSSFDEVAAAPGASAGGYLKLDSTARPVVAPYAASFMFIATKESAHEIWLAGTAPEDGISPFSFSMDSAPWQQADITEPVSRYAKGFAWYRIGAASLSKGQHTLQIQVDGPGQAGSFKLGIDAIVVSPERFEPDGITKP